MSPHPIVMTRSPDCQWSFRYVSVSSNDGVQRANRKGDPGSGRRRRTVVGGVRRCGDRREGEHHHDCDDQCPYASRIKLLHRSLRTKSGSRQRTDPSVFLCRLKKATNTSRKGYVRCPVSIYYIFYIASIQFRIIYYFLLQSLTGFSRRRLRADANQSVPPTIAR